MTKQRLMDDVKEAMRAKDQKKLSTLRLITAAIKQIEVDEREPVNEERLLTILVKMAKQREESIALYTQALRDDLVAQENYELTLIRAYLPEPLSETEIQQLVDKAIAQTEARKMADMGKVMAILKPEIQGRADIAAVSAMIKKRLSAA